MNKIVEGVVSTVLGGLILTLITVATTKDAKAGVVAGACGCCAGGVASVVKS